MRRAIKMLSRFALVGPSHPRGRSPRHTRPNTPLTFELEPMEPRVLLSAAAIDVHNDPLHVDPLPPVVIPLRDSDEANAATADGLDASAGAAPYGLDQTFLLHSDPGASQTIYLDFNGHVTENTYWNSSYGVPQIVTPAYDFDGNVSLFSDAELQRIQYIFDRVAEDFIPFDVDVTTEEPDAADLIKSDSSDTRWGTRVVIGGSSSDWYGAAAGGVAYYNSFNWNTDTPAFVFEANLGNGHEKYTAEAISHEAGHTLNLRHDGQGTTTEYYRGQGSGETGWAPIMGVGYYESLTQWSRGEYTDANNTEDDLAIITGNNGFGYRADDHGDTLASATSLSIADANLSGTGIIERNTDFDVFSFATAAGQVTLDISPFERGPNLDVLAELLDSSGNLVAQSNPIDLLSASMSLSLDAGTYYLRVSGTGAGDPLTTGYSDYASLGRYTITGQVVSPGTSVSVGDATVNEADGQAVFTVSLSEASSGTVTVGFATAAGSATAGDDYQSIAQTVTFAPGQTTATVAVPIVDDLASEATETFSVMLTGVTGDAVILDGQGTGTILDNDVTISVGDASVQEGNPNKGKKGGVKLTNMTFTVSLTGPSSSPVSVQYATGDGTATAGSDYYAASGTLTFNPGETSKTVTVSVVGDSDVEPDETLYLNLTGSSGAAIADGQGLGRIVNDDSAGGTTGGGKGGGGGGGGGGGHNGGPKKSAEPILAAASSTGRVSGPSVFPAEAPHHLTTLLNSLFTPVESPGHGHGHGPRWLLSSLS